MSFEGSDFNTEIVELPYLKNLHKELIQENIKFQIDRPFENKADFEEVFSEQIEETLNMDGIDDDGIRQVKSERDSFYSEIIELISQKYSLECDIETVIDKGPSQLKDCCEAMYSFFIIKYKKNIRNFFVNYITRNRKSIINYLDQMKKKKDVTSISLKKKIIDPDTALIIANLPDVIEYIKSLDMDMLNVLSYLNQDNFNIDYIDNLMKTSVMNCNFQCEYLSPIFDNDQNGDYDDIMSSIQRGLINIK